MRAIEPVETGSLRSAGFRLGYEVFGKANAPALLLLPAWQIVHSRIWKLQVPYLARFRRVVTFDPPGNGAGERTSDPRAFELERIVEQAIGLLDHLGIARAAVIGFSRGCAYGLLMAARHPGRVERLILIASGTSPDAWLPMPGADFWQARDSYEGWQKNNGRYWLEHYSDWVAFFFGQVFTEPHSTKAIDDCTGWAHETTPEILTRTTAHAELLPEITPTQALALVRCPVLLIHGDADRRDPIELSRALLAARPDWSLLTIEGAGHAPLVRDPVRLNDELGRFLDRPEPAARRWRRAASRSVPRALFVSSPIGLGHIQRDLAIARELRRIVPELTIDWLAQPPVSRVLARSGETIHPLSDALASESAHWEHAAQDHRLHCFYAWRDMDEILLANFGVFLEAVRTTAYDLWIGDEAWEVDHYLHENPELKAAPYVFLTDFVGWLPIDRASGAREAQLTADCNAQMLAQVRRYGRIRDRALYIGDYDDILPERFGPGLPLIPDWTREHFTAVGYVVPFDPAAYRDTRALRARLGYQPDRELIICAAGGTAVGQPLLRAAIDAWPLISRERPAARCVVVAGPRVDPASLPRHPGLEVRPYVHDLYEHLAAADLGIVQGGLSTTMELTVCRRPFLYFPIRDHCEQQFNVAYRLDRYCAGRRLDLAATGPAALADAALAAIGSGTAGYRDHQPGAARRAAELIAQLL